MRHLRPSQPSRVTRARAAAAVGLAALATLTTTASSAATAHSSGLVVASLKTARYGTILVSTRTVYTLAPSRVACTATCLKYWPELLLPKGTTHATAGTGVTASQLGTVRRAGGRLQVTYAGKALYWFSKDTGAGQVKGNVTDTWGKWSDVVLVKPSTTTTTTTGGGGGGIGF
jgi:predicted lipoprotein with Yx(FWY)xxD motif